MCVCECVRVSVKMILCKLLIVGGSKGYFIPPFTKCELLKSLCCWKRQFDHFYLWSACVCVYVSVCTKQTFSNLFVWVVWAIFFGKFNDKFIFRIFFESSEMWFYKWLGSRNFFITLNFVNILIHFINLSLILQSFSFSFSNSLNVMKEDFGWVI